MSGPQTAFLTGTALLSFAFNSLLCRAALAGGLMDAATFTFIRLVSGALALAILARGLRSGSAPSPKGPWRWIPAVALFSYALPFSMAYLRIPAGTGAFVLFGCVQITMIGWDLAKGRRLSARETGGVALALVGLGWLTRPGVQSPDPVGVLLMAMAGVSWGAYSVLGRTAGPPVPANARNFAAAVPLALMACALGPSIPHVTMKGTALALVSGAVTSGLGYVAWYAAIPELGATHASIVQLAVPPLASVLGVLLLGETLNARLLTAAPLILGGISLALLKRTRS